MVRVAQRGTLLKMSVSALENRLSRLEGEFDMLYYSKKHKTKNAEDDKLKEKRITLVKSEYEKTTEILKRIIEDQRKK